MDIILLTKNFMLFGLVVSSLIDQNCVNLPESRCFYMNIANDILHGKGKERPALLSDSDGSGNQKAGFKVPW